MGGKDESSSHPRPAQTGKLNVYRGNCHCGAFRFTLRIPEVTRVQICNCSICTRNGYKWIFVADENMVVETGEGDLRSYEFGSKSMPHFFCPKCGSSVMGRRTTASGRSAVEINARLLKDFDLEALEVEKFDGRSLEPKYLPPHLPSWNGEVEDGFMIYKGACHCGKITYVVKTKPLNQLKVMNCNCSLCSRNGDLWIYPSKTAVQLHGSDYLTHYAFLEKTSLHSFCNTCGVSVVVTVTDPKDDIMPLNVRTIEGINLENLEYQKYDGKSNDPQYLV